MLFHFPKIRRIDIAINPKTAKINKVTKSTKTDAMTKNLEWLKDTALILENH
jgi:hypothetical protein